MNEKFLVAYDLNKQGQDYPRLHQALQRLGAKHEQGSVWLLDSAMGIDALNSHLQLYVDSNDYLMVVKVADIRITGGNGINRLLAAALAGKSVLAQGAFVNKLANVSSALQLHELLRK